MSNTRELRRRIKSVKNTAQITKAMQMVAATKMRKAQTQALNGRSYFDNLMQSLARLLSKVDPKAHPLLFNQESLVKGVVLLSTDKGLVGALNTNILRAVATANFPANTKFYTIGKKGRSFLSRTGKELLADFENIDIVTFRQARQLAKLLTVSFLSGEIGEAYLIYPQFVSTLKQEAKTAKLLPIELSELSLNMPVDVLGEFLIEPSSDELLDEILTHYLEFRIYQALLESKASEHSARMIAMQNATDNAKDLVDDLRLTYNQTRQSAITTELLEITTAQIALG